MNNNILKSPLIFKNVFFQTQFPSTIVSVNGIGVNNAVAFSNYFNANSLFKTFFSKLQFSTKNSGDGGNTNPPNHAPIAKADTYATHEDTSLVIQGSGVLSNDSDSDGNALSAILVSGPAHGSLTLNANGSFIYKSVANYNGPDSFSYKASDGVSHSNIAIVNINVTAVNDAPAFVLPSYTFSIAENAAINANVGIVLATDIESNEIIYSILSGNDNNAFKINSATGAITVNDSASLDFETTQTFNLVIQAIDNGNPNLSNTTAVKINLTPVNDNAPIINSNGGGDSANISINENTTAVTTVTAADADLPAQHLTYSIIGGADQFLFLINGQTGVLRFASGPNYEIATDANGDNVYNVVVKVTDPSGLFDQQAIAVTILPVNEAPFPTYGSVFYPNEDQVFSIPAHILGYSDFDVGDVLTLSVVDNPLHGALILNPDGSFVYTPDANYNGPDSFTYRVFDGELYSTNVGTVTLNISSLNDAPAGTDKAITIDEDSGYVFSASDFGFTDPNDNPANQFAAVKITQLPLAGILIWYDGLNFHLVATNELINFSDINSGYLFFIPDINANGLGYASFTFQVQDDGLNDFSNVNLDPTPNTIVINVNAVNDAPMVTSNAGGATAAINVAENVLAVTTVVARDIDLPAQTLMYSIQGGADAGLFQIDSSGNLSFVNAPDYENPLDVGADNDYEVIVRVSDGTLFDDQTITVTVTPENDNTPNAGADINVSIPENSLNGAVVVASIAGTDLDLPNDILTYSILSGNANNAFVIDSVTGEIKILDASQLNLDYDDGDSLVANLVVRVTDAANHFDDVAVSVDVTQVNDNAPIIIGGNSVDINVAENILAVTTVVASDVDLPPQILLYEIVGGADFTLFQINSSGDLSFINAPDYENPLDVGADNNYEVVVRVSDGTGADKLFDEQTINVHVTQANEFVVGVIIDNDITVNEVDENAAIGTVVGVTALAIDGDGDVVTYSLDDDAGGLFAIDTNTGVVSVAGALDYELATSYQIVVKATSSDLSESTKNFTIQINPVNDNTPNAGADIQALIPENSLNGAVVVASIAGTDLDLPNDALTYSILSGNANNAFEIDSVTGEIKILDASQLNLDYDDGDSLVANLIVRVTDAVNHFDDVAVSVNVSPVNEAPAFAAPYTFTITENLPNDFTIGAATATDVDSNAITYSITSGNASGAFAIDANTGLITVNDYTKLDFETTPIFNLTVQALDDGVPAASSTTSLTINLTNLSDLFTSGPDTVNFATLSLPLGGGNLLANYDNPYNANAGADVVTLLPHSDEANNMSFDFNQIFYAGDGNDTISFSNAVTQTEVTKMELDLGTGVDILTLGSGDFQNQIIFSNAETIVGGTGDDHVTSKTALVAGNSVNLGNGDDSLNLWVPVNTFSAFGVETIIGSGQDQILTLQNSVNTGMLVYLVGGNDTLKLANGSNSLVITSVESIIGGTGSDTLRFYQITPPALTLINIESLIAQNTNNDENVTLANNQNGLSVNLLGNAFSGDKLNLAAGSNTISAFNIEFINGSTSDDALTLMNAQNGVTVDLSSGTDILNLAAGSNTISASNIESINGTTSNDTLTLLNIQNGATINLNSGTDILNLAAGINAISAVGIEFISGTGSDDILTLLNPQNTTQIDLSGGNDRLNLANGGNSLIISNIETVIGGTGTDVLTFNQASLLTLMLVNIESLVGQDTNAENVTLTNNQNGLSIDFKNGTINQTLSLAAGSNTISAFNIESINGTASDDTLTLLNTLSIGKINLAGGTDTLNLAAGSNTISAINVEFINGTTSNDTLTFFTSNTQNGLIVDLSSGIDVLNLGAGSNTISAFNIESINGTTSNDTLTLSNIQNGTTINLNAGGDILNLAAGINAISAVGIEFISGTGSDDILTLLNPQNTAQTNQVNLSGGNDILNLANGGNSLDIVNIETVIGGTGTDVLTLRQGNPPTLTLVNIESLVGQEANAENVTLKNNQNGLSIDFRGGNIEQILNLAAGSNTISALSIDIINGTASDDTLTLLNTQNGRKINLAGGTDTLILTGANMLAVSNVETIIGGSGIDNLTVSAAISTVVSISGGDGDDTIVGGVENDIINGGLGVDDLTGGLGADTFVLNSAFDYSSTEVVNGTQEDDTLDTLLLLGGGAYNFTSASTNITYIDQILLSTDAAYTLTLDEDVIATADRNGNGSVGDLKITSSIDIFNNLIIDASLQNTTNDYIEVDGSNFYGNDTITGTDGADTILAGFGIDTVFGGSGADTYIIRASLADSYFGRPDTISTLSSSDTLKIIATSVNNFNHTTHTTTVSGGAIGEVDLNANGDYTDTTDVYVNFINKTTTTDFRGRLEYDLTGDGGANTITTGALDDTISGGAGADTLAGGAGADTLAGGAGADTLAGGLGADIFKFTGTGDLGDTITDFSAAQLDKLWFSGAAFNGDSGTALAAGALTTVTNGSHNSASASVYWIFDNGTTKALYYDADANNVDGGADVTGVLVANLTGISVLNNTDLMFG